MTLVNVFCFQFPFFSSCGGALQHLIFSTFTFYFLGGNMPSPCGGAVQLLYSLKFSTFTFYFFGGDILSPCGGAVPWEGAAVAANDLCVWALSYFPPLS